MSALSGIRVLDLGIVTAGAGATAVLADLGAEVIKVESPTYVDPFRQWSADTRIDADAPVPPFFRATNRNKSGISLDLKSPEGREVFLRLLDKSDVVVENFRRGVMERLGLGYDVLKARNPGVILASVASQGNTGPDADYVSFGSTLEAVSGMAWLTGYEGGPPLVTGVDVNYPDQVTTIFAAGLISAALVARRSSGVGAHIDISQRELASFLIGERFMTDDASTRQGNRQEPYAVQDCFLSKDRSWIAVSAMAEDFVRIEGFAPAGDAPADLAAWIAAQDADEALAKLADAGVRAARALGGEDVMAEKGKGWEMALARMADGAYVKGFPFQLERQPLEIRSDAPKLGDDTADVLMRVGGYTQSEIAGLIARKVVEQRRGSQ